MCTAEGLLYIEVGTMPFGILFAILGACILATDKKLRYLISLILVTISGLFYQVTSSIFVLLALVLIAIKHKGNIKLVIKDTIIIALIYGFAMIVNFVGVKLWDKALQYEFRKFEFPSIATIIGTILKFGETILIYNVGIGPKYWYIALLVVLTIIFIAGMILRKKNYFMILEYIVFNFIKYFSTTNPYFSNSNRFTIYRTTNGYVFWLYNWDINNIFISSGRD